MAGADSVASPGRPLFCALVRLRSLLHLGRLHPFCWAPCTSSQMGPARHACRLRCLPSGAFFPWRAVGPSRAAGDAFRHPPFLRAGPPRRSHRADETVHTQTETMRRGGLPYRQTPTYRHILDCATSAEFADCARRSFFSPPRPRNNFSLRHILSPCGARCMRSPNHAHLSFPEGDASDGGSDRNE